MSDREHLERGDVWSNKAGWQSRDEAAREMAREMLPMSRSLWNHHMKTDISDDDLLDLMMEMQTTPLHAALGG